MGILFRHTAEDEVGILTEMSTDAFLSDTALAGEAGGPTGYDDYEFHLCHQKSGDLYSLLGDGKIVGGSILKRNGDCLYSTCPEEMPHRDSKQQ